MTAARDIDFYELTEEQALLRGTLREFAQGEIAPPSSKLDETGEFPWENIRKMRELGLFGMIFPPEYGGAGLDTLSYAIAVEEISRACASTGITLAAHTSLGTWPIYRFGTDAQKRKYLPALCSGEKLAAFGLTEPEAGSDAGGTQTRAVKEGDRYKVNGRKIYITNGSVAGTAVFTAVTTPGIGIRGISSFIVAKGTPGFSAGGKERKLGHRASDTVELLFENLSVPAEDLLGQEGEGFKQFMMTLDGGRISIGAMSVGIGQVRPGAAAVRQGDRRIPGRPAPLGRNGHRIGSGAPPGLPDGAFQGSRRALHAPRRHGEAEGVDDRDEVRQPRDPDPRRGGVHDRPSGGALLPRRQVDGDRRGDLADPDARHRPRIATRGGRRVRSLTRSRRRMERRISRVRS
jgi:butyryl-CoA dehydrogenase